MEVQEHPFDDQEKTTPLNSSASNLYTVDTSRPFRSVKEAVAIFGERFLAREIYTTPKPSFTIPRHETITQKTFSPLFSPPPSLSSLSVPINDNDQFTMKDSLKKLEAELKETKRELELLKEREYETEIALASLNAELHKNMSKMSEAEAKSAGEKALVVATRSTSSIDQNHQVIKGKIEEEAVETMYLKSLAEVLRLGDKEGYFGEKKTKMKKKKKKKKKNMEKEKEKEMKKKKLKPIIPLVGDLLSWKKNLSSSTKNNTLHNPLYTSDHVY